MSMIVLAAAPSPEGVDPVFIILAKVCFMLAAGLAVASLVALLFFRRSSFAGLACAVGAILVGQYPLLFSAYLYRTSSTAPGGVGTQPGSALEVALPLAVVIAAALLAAAWQWRISRTSAK